MTTKTLRKIGQEQDCVFPELKHTYLCLNYKYIILVLACLSPNNILNVTGRLVYAILIHSRD